MQQVDVLRDVALRLDRAGLEYMLTGSVAANFYVTERTTIDIDLVVAIGFPDVDRIVELFADTYYLDETAIVDAITCGSSFNLIHYSLQIKVDLIIGKDTEYRREQFRRRHQLPYSDVTIWVIAPEDLVLAKLDWARDSRSEKQLNDVKTILSRVEALDHQYLDFWAGRLGVASLLGEVRS